MAGKAKPVTIEAEPEIEDLQTEIAQSNEELDGILEADFSSPTKLKVGKPYLSNNNPAYKFYMGIAPKLAGWWNEFSGELDQKTGGPKYKTIHQFAQAKVKTSREQEWLEQMIGPEPAAFNWKCKGSNAGKWLRVPWLGDWKARRMNGYWAPEQPNKVKALVKSLKEKLGGLQAIQSAAPYLVQEMARYTRMGEQIDQVFGGQALDLNKGPMDESNKSRFYTYLEMQKALTRVKLRLVHEWMLVHGVNPANPVLFNQQINQLVLGAGGGYAGASDGMSNKDLQAVKLARMLQLHAENFDMPLPESGVVAKKDQEPAKVQKGNGKVM